LVAIDYFTKWVEAEPLAKITEARVQDFIWKSIIYRYGLPKVIITDNGRQFSGAKLRKFCEDHMIQQRFTSVAHPQANGEAEVTNRTLLQGIKARLERARGSWVDELQHVLWAYRTTQRVPTGETPFNLAFGTEAVIPLEFGIPSLRVEEFDKDTNAIWLRANLDLVEESRERAAMKMASYRQRVARYYNTRAKPKEFRSGDLVLRRAEISQPSEQGKLAPNWEGPYYVEEVVRPGTYRLKSLDGVVLPRPWNSANLRIYYP